MKPVSKKDKASCSVSEESSSQRPKRSTYLKTLDGSNGLLWREENDLKRALYASLQETRKRNLDEEETAEDEEEEAEAEVKEAAAAEVKKEEAAVSEDGEDEILKKAKVHAQRKFAQGTNPNSPVPTPQKVPPVNNSTKELLPYKRPKTEDFLTFLCLRGTSILPPSLDFLNCCSKSDTSSDCRSLSPDPEAKDLGSHKESVSKGSEPREKNSARHENLSNGVSRKLAVCKAPLKKHVLSSQTAKKTGSKSQKEINIVRKRKSRDESEDEFLPTNSSLRTKTHVNARTRSSTFHALREKYKKQRIAADKKKVPSSGNAEVKGLTTRSQSTPKKTSKTVSRQAISSKRQSRSLSPVHNKRTGPQQKLAIEKRKSLRSADPPKGPAHRKDSNKKRLLRRAKMVPPIVDVESESDPEVINESPTRKTSLKQEKSSRLSGRLRDKQDGNKSNEGLTSRQILLRKHMQSRLAAKKSALHAKNLKSKTIVKKTAKQVISKKVFKKNLVSKTMSLRKDLQNKRVTRSAKHQIEEMLWSHPEKKAKSSIAKGLPASRTDKKRISSDEQLIPKKSKIIGSKVVENKQGKSATDKEVKTRSVDGNKVVKPTTTSKVLKKTDSLMSTRSLKTVSSNEPKPGCSHDVDDVLQPKINNANKSSIGISKKEAHISDLNKHITNNTSSFSAESQEKSNKMKMVEEQKSSKLPCKVDSFCNIKPHDDKESNLIKKDNNLDNSKHSLLVTDEVSVQNNLNMLKNDKIISKDISKLINLNVECDESVLALNSETSCSGKSQNDINKKLNQESPQSLNSEPLPSLSFIKKHYDPKYIKNISYKAEKLKNVLDKNRKEPNKFIEKSSKSHKKDLDLKSPDKSKVKKGLKKQRKESFLSSDSDSNTEIIESALLVGSSSKGKNKSELSAKEKSEMKKNQLEKLNGEKRPIKVDHKKESKKTKLEFSKDVNLKSDSKVKNDSKKHSVSLENTSSIFDQDTDDDSDIDITLGEYLKKKSKESVGKNTTTVSPTKEINTDIKSVPSTSKDSKTSKKDSEKESQKSKKEGESSKHKKEKNSSKDKMSRRDSEKSLAKLLKRERSKSLRKEKLKHKRDGSSSSKSSKDKDGSKLNKKDGEKDSSSDRRDSKGEFSDTKKDKSSKKESKLSRSNSYDDTKSPKKKKKLTDEFKQIEEIKNFISNSSILNEISEFKRRLSGDKSEFKKRLSKSKKRKKLALLKEKKLSKKLSSKLLRKYSKKKGLKKKNKLKKKELRKEGKTGTSSTKSKNKSKKHKTKGEHKKDSQDKIKNSDKSPSCSISTETICPLSILTEPLPTVTQKNLNFPQPITSSIETSTGHIAIPLTLSNEAISKVNNSPTLSVTRRESLDQVFTATNSCTSTSTSTSISESTFPSEAFVQAKRNSISQVPLHFAPKASNRPKTMTDAATNTCDDDIDETLSPIPELLKNVEMSVGTQTITPVGSPSPTAEMKSIVPLVPTVSPLLTNSKTSCSISNISVKSISKLQQSDTATTSVRSVSNHVTGTAVLPKNFGCVKNIVPNTQIITSPSILPKTFSNANTANVPKNFTLSPGQYKCLQVLPVSPEKSKLSPYKNSPSLIIPIVTPGISNPVMVKNDGLSKGIVCASNSVPNIAPAKSTKVQNCVNNLVIPISPNKHMLLANSMNFNSPANFKVLASNSKPALIMDKNTITTSNTVSIVSPIKPSVPVCPTNLASPVSTEKSTMDISSATSVTPGKSSVNISAGTSIIPGKSTANVAAGTSITPGKSTLNVSAGTSITPVKSTLNISAGTSITPGKSTLNIAAGTSITPGKSTLHIAAGTSITPEKSTMACKVNNHVPAVTTINTNDANSTTPAKNDTSTICHTQAPVVTSGKPKVPSSSSSNASQQLTPGKSKVGTPNTTPGSSPKVKKRNVKKTKSSSPPQLQFEPFPVDTARLVSAPVYYPKADEFSDPLEYINKIRSEAEQYGICKIVPPASFKPECKVNDDMRFTAHNQYLHKMLHRWGPNVQHTACIRKHLKSQKVKLEQPPLIGGIELDVSKFYHTVQQFGGLQQVIEKKKWQKVADVMRVPKTAQDRVTKLYDAYCKYLVSYDTLPAEEKQKIEEEVKADHEKWVKLRNSTSDSSEKEEDEMEDENNDCVTKGRSMSLSNFFRIARNTMSMWFKNDPPPEEVENEFWKLVTERQQHVVVHAGNIDSSVTQSGFPTNKSAFAKHPWNLKILTNNSRSILKSMGPLSGITIPTLHVGMLFTTGCWYRDPHSFPWIEYLHTGASKIWYGIPAKGCEKFRNAMRKIMPDVCTTKPLWLSSDTAMVPPDLLVKHGASLSRTIQSSGQFIVIFPESFTSTICCGYCVSESVYFAPTSWLDLAVKAFQDIQNSCESPAFSLERLLFSIANDPKPQLKVHLKILQKILPMIENIRFKELHLRAQLNESGLKQFDRLPLIEVQGKKKKSRNAEEENEHECEVCRTPCYVSMVIYPQEDTVYCLPHALEHIQKKNLKLCKLKYTYSEHDLNELIKKITDLVSQLPSPSIKKKLPKKKVSSVDEK
ncbi:hypothetical protein JTE90_000570 [Oedothorax gibbosus]|uniref:Protein Jumonji n=1 Tax=Oedothorax gibbosus TaxID=931172 RepID=A0AAV6VV52_9ARAC|nr:hypothetical protein JTE90_000570 [Oedothorax gibbosus]